MSEAEPTVMSHEDLVEAIETAASHALRGTPLPRELIAETSAEIGRLAAYQVAGKVEDMIESIETAASHALHGSSLSHEQHVKVCSEIGRLAAWQIVGRVTALCVNVRGVVAEAAARAIREAPILEDLKERLSAALVDDIAARVAASLADSGVPRPAASTSWPDWARPGWILGARVIPTLAEAARADHGPSHAVTRALSVWNDYGELIEADRAVLSTWVQEHELSPVARLRELAAAIEKFLTALEARAAFLTSATRTWVSRHTVEVDVAAIRRACEMAIQHRPRDGTAPHVTLSADVLLALAEYARWLREGLLAARDSAHGPVAVLVELAARGPVVGGDGAPDAEGSVVQPASRDRRWSWIETDDVDTRQRGGRS